MVTITSLFANILSPSATIIEQSAGYRVLSVASHSALYMLGSGSTGPYNEPTLCRNLDDWKNQFGGSLSEPSVKLLFRNDPQAVMFYVRVGVGDENTLTVNNAVSGNYVLSVNGTSVTFVAVAANDADDIAEGLITAINSSAAGALVTAFSTGEPGEFSVRPDRSTTELDITVSAGAVTVEDTTPIAPQSNDYISAIENSFDYEEGWAQGFIFAPEAFLTIDSSVEKQSVGAALEQHAADHLFDWKAIVDCETPAPTALVLKADGERYASPQGHTDFVAPYLIDFEGEVVPASAGVAAMATRMFKQRGYHHPYAGAKFPLFGVRDVTVNYSRQEQDVLNPLGINLIRNLRNKGVVVWAMRSRSSDSYYRFSSVRIIFNVLNGTLRSAFDNELFTAIDGPGVLLARIEETAIAVCNQMWQGGALFGTTAQDAYAVRCSFQNNDSDSIERGQVLLEVYAAPAPGLEKLLIATYRTSVGQVQSSASAGLVVDRIAA